jgi:hypothetical protein
MAAALPGPWRRVDNQYEIAAEVRAYGEARRLLRLYAMLLLQIFKRRQDLTSVATVDAVAATIAGLSQEPDLMHGFYEPGLPPFSLGPWVWQFHTAYLDFSQTDTRSRSWLLTTLPDLLHDLTLARRALTDSERANSGYANLAKKATDAYEAWRALAQPRVHVPQAALRAREEGPRPRRAQLPHLLKLLGSLSN